MEIYVILALIALAILLLSIVTSNAANKRKVFKDNVYTYTAKILPMTKAGSEFFFKLDEAVSERYYVFPQVHLSSVLDHKVKGQDWRYAFRHKNGKFVDYVLCDKQNLQPACAIELDDYSHDKADRQKRDKEVERIFEGANLPLIRFKNKDASTSEIINALSEANAGRE